MRLLQPAWLLLLPLWPLVLLLLRARQQRQVLAAPDFLLWQRAAALLPAAASRARISWKDMAWIAPPVLLTLGLAQPEVASSSKQAPVVVLVDGSASMETRAADGTSRRERGLAEARRLLGSRSFSTETGPPALAEAATTLHAAGIPVLVVTDAALPELPAEAGVVQITDGARNAGIVSAGFDPETGLLVRVEADPGAGARTLVIAAGDRVLEKKELADPTSFRIVLPPETVAGARVVTVKLEPPDALALDDEVTLTRSASPVRVSVAETPPPAIERALRAVPGVEIVHGGGGESAITLLVAPLSGQGGFETGAPVARDGAISGTRSFEGLSGPARWPALYPLVKEPPGTERLLEVGGAPLLVRSGRTFALLADPDENGWAALPGFPLTIARIVESGSDGAKPGLAVRQPAVLSPSETHVARGAAGPSRAPAPAESIPASVRLAPWCFAAALAMMLVLGIARKRI